MGIRRAEFDRCFELEALEPRMMLSAEGFGGIDAGGDGGARIELLSEGETEESERSEADGFGAMMFALSDSGPVWVNAEGGNWNDAANWASGDVPGAGADVVISGLGEDAVVTLTGNTPALASLTIESGTVVIEGALQTQTLNVAEGATLRLSGSATSTITGDVNVAAGAELSVEDTAVVIWSGGGEWANYGRTVIADEAEFRSTAAGEVNVRGGIFEVEAGASVRLTDMWGNFFVRGGEFRLNGEFVGTGSEVEIVVSAGAILSGTGVLTNPRAIELHGTLAPGASGEGSVGKLTIHANVNFSSTQPWSVQLDVVGANNHDVLELTRAVTFSGGGKILVNASSADFSGTENGTVLAGALLTVTGSVTGTPTIDVTGGTIHSVQASWVSGTKRLQVTTVSMTTISQAVSAGLLSATAKFQSMLIDYNLGSIDLTAQGRTPFSLPGLSLNLADSLNLSAFVSQVALPVITPSASLAQLISDLQAVGFQVTEPGEGVELRGLLSRTIADGLVLAVEADRAFLVPDEVTAGWADGIDFAITGALMARLVQNIVFEVRDGEFVLAVGAGDSSHLYLSVAGAAEVAGSAQSGGRTVTVEGEIEVDYDVWMHHGAAGSTPAASGSSVIELSTTLGALDVTMAASAARSIDAAPLITTSTDAVNLGALLRFDGLTAPNGTPLTLAMTGERAGDGWNLKATGSDARLLELTVDGWELGATLSPTSFAGAGAMDVRFDFLRKNDAVPVVELTATFDAESMALSGGIAGTVSIAAPGGATYLTTTDFAGTVNLATDFGAVNWTGAGFAFTASSATFGREGSRLAGSVTDGADADAHALVGSYDFGTQTITTTIDQLELVADTVVQLAVAGVVLRHTRNGADEQELGTAAEVPVELLFLSAAPGTGPPSFTAASVTLRTDGVLIGAGSTTLGEITLGAGITLQGAQIDVGGFAFVDGEMEADDVTLSATTATVFAGNAFGYTANASNLTGTYDFSGGTIALALNAAEFVFELPGRLEFTVSDAVLQPENDVVWSAGEVAVTLPYFNIAGELANVALTSSGEMTTDGLTLDADNLQHRLKLGGLLPFGIENLVTDFAGDMNGNGLRDHDEAWRVDDFALIATGGFDFGVLSKLPFDVVVKVGATELASGDDALPVTLRWMNEAFVPWETELISVGVGETPVGSAFTLEGGIILGYYEEGSWRTAVGGTMGLGYGTIGSALSGTTTVAVSGELDAEAGTLTVNGDFSVSVTLAGILELEDISVGWTIGLALTGEENLELEVTAFGLTSAGVGSVTASLGEFLIFRATGAEIDFMATGSERMIFVESASAELPMLGIEGWAKNFGLNADGTLWQGADFGVGLSLTTASIFWPEWLPLATLDVSLEWEDWAQAPADFTILLNASLNAGGIGGSGLEVIGSITGAEIDVGLLHEGAFPLVDLGEVAISISGDIGSASVNGALILGLARVSEAGQLIEADDRTTPVKSRVLWGAIQAGLEIQSLGGLNIWLGLSQLGPLQGYVKASIPVPLEPTGRTGMVLNHFRTGITFNTSLPAVTDARELRNDPGFTPIAELEFEDWREMMLSSLAMQVAANAEGGTLAVLLNPFRLDGGVTLYNTYITEASFRVEADFAMDSTGKFFLRGRFVAGDAVSFTARLYFDVSRFVSDGEAVILFLADLPSEFPLFTVYGGMSINFGVEIDPENPPSNPLEQFSITIMGGWELGVPDMPAVTVEGSVRFEIALNAPSLRTVVEGVANVAGLGDVVSLAGDLELFFGEDEKVALVGVMALAPGEFAVLKSLGLNFEGVAVLRINTTANDLTQELKLPAEETPRNFALPAGVAGLLLEGWLGFELFNVELYRVEGVFSLAWSGNTFDVLAHGVLSAGPTTAPLLRLQADGYLKIVFEGIDVGLAALFKLSINEGDDAFSVIGIEVGGEIEFRLNTTGEDVDYVLAGAAAGSTAVDRIYLPRGPPAPDGTPAEEAQPYAIVRAMGTLAVLDAITIDGVFDFRATGEAIDLDYVGGLTVRLAGNPLLVFEVNGRFRLDENGLYGASELALTNDPDAATTPLGFWFETTFLLQINTTGVEQTLDGWVLPEGIYARLLATGRVVTGGIVLAGEFYVTMDAEEVKLGGSGTLSLSVAGAELIKLGYVGEMQVFSDGIFAEMTLSRIEDGRDVFGFGFSSTSSYTLKVNTTTVEREGVPAGLGAQVVVTGALEIADVSLEGVYTLTATTTGIGLAASAALAFRDGENELFRLPAEFEIELTFPGIAERIDLDVDPATLGLTIFDVDFAGTFYLEVNTTPEAANGIPAGPILRAGFEGILVIDTLELDGTWLFDATLSLTQIIGTFTLSMGAPGEEPLITWSGATGLNLGLNGVAGYATLEVDYVASPMEVLLSGDFAFELLINTSPGELTIGDRVLPAGPLVAVTTNGTLTIETFELTGGFRFVADAAGVRVDADAVMELSIGDSLTLFRFTATGGLLVDAQGMAAALDLTLVSQAWSDVGMVFDGGAEFRLRINTTGEVRTIGEAVLEAGSYGRIEFEGSLSVGTFALKGDFTLTAANSTADLTINGVLEVAIPGAEEWGLSLGAVGGLRVDPAGVTAAFDLSLNAASDEVMLSEGFGVSVDSTHKIALRLNTTGEERTVAGITLEAGNYFSFRITGKILSHPMVLIGEFGFKAADTGLIIDVSATVGLVDNEAEVPLLRLVARGEIHVIAAGVFAAISLQTELGDGFGDHGFGFRAGTSFTLAFNSTDQEINGIPARSLWAVRIEGALVLGNEDKSIDLVGAFTLTPTSHGTVLIHGKTSFVLVKDGVVWVDVPFEFEQEIEAEMPALAFRVGLEETFVFPEADWLRFEARKSYLLINATSEEVEFGDEVIPAGPTFELVYDGTLVIDRFEVDGLFRFTPEGDGVMMFVAGETRIGERNSPLLRLRGEGGFQAGESGFSGRMAVVVSGGSDALTVPMNGEMTHHLFINTRDVGVEVEGIVLPAGPTVELHSTGVLNLAGFAFDGSMRMTAGADGFSMGVDANLEIRVPGLDTPLLSVPVLGGFTIDSKGFSAALDVEPETAFFEPVGLVFGSDATYFLRINTTGEARNEHGIELEAGNYARIESTGTLALGTLMITGGYAFQLDNDLVRVAVMGTAVLTVAGDGALAGELLRTDVQGELGIGPDGTVGALDAAIAVGAPQFALGEWTLPVGAELGSRIRLNTTGSDRVVAGYTMGAREVFMWEVIGGVTLGSLRIEGMSRFTAGDDLVRWENTGRVALLSPLEEGAEIFAGEGTLGMEISDVGVAGVALLAGAPTNDAANLGVELAFDAELDLRFNTTGQAVTIGDVTLEAGNYFEGGVTGALSLLWGVHIEGTHFVRVSGDGVSLRSSGTVEFELTNKLSLTFGTDIYFTFADDGVYGTAALTVGATTFGADGVEVTFDAGVTPILAINTSAVDQVVGSTTLTANSVSLGLAMDLTLFGQTFSGQAVLTVEKGNELVVMRHEGVLAVTVGDWSPFVFGYDGYFIFGDGGVATSLDLVLQDEALNGGSVHGTWSLRASTFESALNLAGFMIGGVTVPALAVEAGPMLRIYLSGGLKVESATLDGEFEIEVLSDRMMLHADIALAVFGVEMSGTGTIIASDDGIVADIAMLAPTVTTAGFTLAGDFVLRLNTTNGTVNGIPANYVRVAVNNAVISVPGATLKGSTSIDLDEGVTLRVDGMTATLAMPKLGGASMTINGWMNPAGEFNVSGTMSLAVGNKTAGGIFGTAAVTISHDGGIRGSISNGELYVPGGDYARLNGSFRADANSFEVDVNQTAFVLLGGIVRIDGAFRITGAGDLYTLWAKDLVGSVRIPGWNTSFVVNGWLNSEGDFNLDGAATLNAGSYPPNENASTLQQRNWTLGVRSSVAVNISREGVRGAVAGTVFVPGDWANFTGALEAGSWGFDLSVNTRFVLLGGAVLFDGGLRAEMRNSTLTVWANGLTAESRIPGVASSFAVEGWINTAGDFHLSGDAMLALGRRDTAGIFGAVNLTISKANGVSAALRGVELVVPGGATATFDGTLRQAGDRFEIDVNRAEFALLKGVATIAGSFRVETGENWVNVVVREATARVTLPGFSSAWGGSGYLNANGEFELRGNTQWDFRLSGQRFASGALEVWLRHTDGLRATIRNGELHVPGDYARLNGSMHLSGEKLVLDVDQTAFVLLGGVVRVDGTFRTEISRDFQHIEVKTGTVRLNLSGFQSTFAVSGFVNSAGSYDLRGLVRLAVGNSNLGVDGDVEFRVQSGAGIHGVFSGKLRVPGSSVDVRGSIEAGSWGLNLAIDRVSYTLLNGLVALDGGARLELRGSTLSMWISEVSARIAGFIELRMLGFFRTDGFFDLDGTAQLRFGNRGTVAAEGEFRINVRSDYGVRAWTDLKVYALNNEIGTLRNALTQVAADGFSLRVNASVRFQDFTLHGLMDMHMRTSGFWANFSGNASLWGHSGSASAWFDSRNGTWGASGSVGFHIGGSFGASGTIHFGIENGKVSMRASGEAWGGINVPYSVSIKLSWWPWESRIEIRYKWVGASVRFDAGLQDGRLHVSMGGIGTITVRLTSGGSAWLSNVGGSMVFLDVNGNRILDEGEPFTMTDEAGNFSFDDPDAPVSGDDDELPVGALLGALAEYDRNGDGILDESEIQLYAVNGVDLSEDAALMRVYRDVNGNGSMDEGEAFVLMSADELTKMMSAAQEGITALPVAGTPLAIFDRNGDAALDESEAVGIVGEAMPVIAPLTPLAPAAQGYLPLADVEFVFADLNGNGVYDVGEPRVSPNEQNFYSFVDEAVLPEADAVARLGRLAPFDTNGNGRIDPEEGVFVLIGGVDRDNGIENPVTTVALADSYGSGTGTAISPLSTLQVALMEQGLDAGEAAELISRSFNLPAGVAAGSYDPRAGGTDAMADAGLRAGAEVTSLLTAGAGLLGGHDDPTLQSAMADALASVLIERDGTVRTAIELGGVETNRAVLDAAASVTGRELDENVLDAAATVLARVNQAVQLAADGDVARNLAALKAVVLTEVSSVLTALGAGEIDAAMAEAALSAEALASLAAGVPLAPNETPTIEPIEDVVARGGDRVVIGLPIQDPDTRLSSLQLRVTSSDETIVAAQRAKIEFVNGAWQLVLPTEAVASGRATITVEVSDGASTASTDFDVMLDGLNQAVRQIDNIPAQTLSHGQTVKIALADYFADADSNATYTLRPVGENRVVEARIVGGELQLTANAGVAGVAIFDLVATDDLATASTRFSVVTYPNVVVSERVRFAADGSASVAVQLSVPSTQTLVLNYRSGGSVGTLVFAAGETSKLIPVNVAGLNAEGTVREIEFGVNGAWVSGSFKVALNTYSAVELLDLRRDGLVAVEFTLSYRFVSLDTEDAEEGVVVLASLGSHAGEVPADAGPALQGMTFGVTEAAEGVSSAAGSLESLERPRAISKI